MAKIPYVTQKIFSELTPSSVGVIGSFRDGSPEVSTDLATIQNSSRFREGLTRLLLNGSSPVLEDFNGLLFLLTSQIRRIQRTGIGEWMSSILYQEGDVVTCEGDAYVCLADDTSSSPLNIYDGASWRLLANRTLFADRPAATTVNLSGSGSSFNPTDIGFASNTFALKKGHNKISGLVHASMGAGAVAGLYALITTVKVSGNPVASSQTSFYKAAGTSTHSLGFSLLQPLASDQNVTIDFSLSFPGAFTASVGGISSTMRPFIDITRIL